MEDHETVRYRVPEKGTIEERKDIIRDHFYELDASGYRDECRSLLEELALGINLAAILDQPKRPNQARKDGDWSELLEGIHSTSSEDELMAWMERNQKFLATLPPGWNVHIKDEIDRHLATLKDMTP
jgi:hypothetical protein